MENNQLFPDGELTELATAEMMSLLGTDEEEDRFPPDVDTFIRNFNDFNPFYEGVYRAAVRHGFSGQQEDNKALEKFVSSACKAANIDLDLRSWLLKKKIPGPAGRDNVYRLCFALGMGALETKEFFLKAYLERPFNYKDLTEAVYFYCMCNQKDYWEACRIIDRIEAQEKQSSDNNETSGAQYTEIIGRTLFDIHDEDQLVAYLISCGGASAVQNVSALREINSMLETCKQHAREDITNYNGDPNLERDSIRSISGISDLLKAIYGRPAREYVQSDTAWDSFSKSDLPKLISQSMPSDIQVSNILSGKDVSSVAIRKLLILLAFYDFFDDPNNIEADGDLYDEFISNTNEILARCGYIQLYMRNPYDWLFLYCAFQEEPIGAFHDIIDAFAGGRQI